MESAITGTRLSSNAPVQRGRAEPSKKLYEFASRPLKKPPRRVVLYPVMDRCGIAREKWIHGFHLFRHTAGSIVHAQTGDLKLAQELLGHSRISTTSDIYIHMPENVAARATEILAREITGVMGSDKVQ